MSDIINFFIDMVYYSSNILDNVVFDVGGLKVSYFDLLLSFSALCIIIAVFWRGVRK